MIISINKDIPKEELDKLISRISDSGASTDIIYGESLIVVGVIGDTSRIDADGLASNRYVKKVERVTDPFKKANRLFHMEDTIVDVDGVKVGGKEKIAVIGGPCSVEDEESMVRIAKLVKSAGGNMLRGGAYKPRTSPYAFQGMGRTGMTCLKRAKEETGLPVVSEIMGEDMIDEFVEIVDLVQIGARNMQNFNLLKAVGRINKPILLKRGLANTIEEWIMAAEYIMSEGNQNVIFCERGIRTFERYTRNTLDLSAIPIIKQKSHLPIIIDPSHATGDWRLVESMSLAAIAAGADGLLIEVHDNPECAMSDGSQCMKPDKFAQIIKKGKEIAKVIGRDM